MGRAPAPLLLLGVAALLGSALAGHARTPHGARAPALSMTVNVVSPLGADGWEVPAARGAFGPVTALQGDWLNFTHAARPGGAASAVYQVASAHEFAACDAAAGMLRSNTSSFVLRLDRAGTFFFVGERATCLQGQRLRVRVLPAGAGERRRLMGPRARAQRRPLGKRGVRRQLRLVQRAMMGSSASAADGSAAATKTAQEVARPPAAAPPLSAAEPVPADLPPAAYTPVGDGGSYQCTDYTYVGMSGWTLPFDEMLQFMWAGVGTCLVFSAETKPEEHDVWLFPSSEPWEACDFSNAKQVANTSDLVFPLLGFPASEYLYFASAGGTAFSDCRAGLKLKVMVEDYSAPSPDAYYPPGPPEPQQPNFISVGGPDGWNQPFVFYTPPAYVGDWLHFYYDPSSVGGGSGSDWGGEFNMGNYHDVWRFPDARSFAFCDFYSGAYIVGNASSFMYQLLEPGDYYFGSAQNYDCFEGLRFAINVQEPYAWGPDPYGDWDWNYPASAPAAEAPSRAPSPRATRPPPEALPPTRARVPKAE